jgi:hypothetical protein
MSENKFKHKLQQLPAIIWLPLGYVLLGILHTLVLQWLPLPATMPEPLADSLQQQQVTLTEIEQSVERLEQLKKLAEL